MCYVVGEVNQKMERNEAQVSLLPESDNPVEPVQERVNVKNFLCLLDSLLPVAWCIAACFGSLVTIVVNFLFMIFYTSWINYSGSVKKKYYAPSIVVILSLVYSVVYIIAELILFYLTKEGTITVKSDLIKYFDIVVFENYDSKIPNVTSALAVAAILDGVWLIVSNIVRLSWFHRAKDDVWKRLNRPLGIVFICGMAIICEIFSHKYAVAVQIPFLLICIVYGLKTREVNRTVVKAFWVLMIVAILGYVVVIGSDLIIELDRRVPRWVHVLVSFVVGYAASVFSGRNRSRCTVRLIGSAEYPIWIRGMAPLPVIVTSFYFCIRQATWLSFVSFIFASVVCFLSSHYVARATPVLFFITLVLAMAQSLTGIWLDDYKFEPQGLYALVGLSALFLSNSRKTTFSATNMTHNPILFFVLSLLSTLLIISQYLLASYLALNNETLVVNIVLYLVVGYGLFGYFNDLARDLVMLGIILTSIVQVILILLISRHGVKVDEDMYNLWFIHNATIWTSLWGPLLLFFISFFLKYIFVAPTSEILFVVQHLLIPMLLVASVIFSDNSIFELIYLLVLIVLLFFSGKKKYKLVAGSVIFDLFFKVFHLVLICLYHFGGIRNRIHSPTARMVLGFPQDGKPKDYTLLGILLTASILCTSLRAAFASTGFQNDKKVTGVMRKVIRIVKHLFSMFSFYILMIAIFLGDVVDYSSSIVQIGFLFVMSLYRMITRKGGCFAFCVFFVFAGAYVMQIICAMIPMPIHVRQTFALIGPSVEGYLSHAVNILAVIASVQYIYFDPNRVNLPKPITTCGRVIARNLVVVVQIVLAVTALEAKRLIAPVSAILCVVLMLKQKMTRAWANFMTVVMLLINTYVMVFAAYPIDDVNKWLVYCMVNSTTPSEMAHSFFHLFFTTMLMEYGVGLEPGFGRTILTAYGFVLVSACVFVLGCIHHDLMILVHLICWVIMIYIGLRSLRTRVRGVYACLWFCTLVMLVKSLTPAPFWPTVESKLSEFFSLNSRSNKSWIVMFVLEFLLYSMLRSEEYRSVQENQERRVEFRTRRQKIISEMYDIDGVFMSNHFEYKLNSVKQDFAALADIGAGLTAAASRDFIPSSESESEVVVPFKVKLVKFLKSLWFWIVDTVIFCLVQLTDINLEPGISEPGLNRLRLLMSELLQGFEEQKKIIVPEEWRDFARTIPYSFAFRFSMVAKIKEYRGLKEQRLLLFKRYFNAALRSIIPIILMCLQIFYPFLNKETSILAATWTVIGFVFVAFKVDNFTPSLIYSTIILLLRYILQMPYVKSAVSAIRDSQEEKERSIPLFTLFGLNVDHHFVVDACMFVFSVISIALTRQHPQIPNPWVGKNGFAKLYSRFNRFSARKISCNVAITLVDFTAFLTLFICYSSWFKHGGNVVDMVSGMSTISPAFIIFLIIHFVFLIAINMAHMSRNMIIYSIIALLDCVASLLIILFAIPYITSMTCLQSGSFMFMLFTRLLSQLFMGVQMRIGFKRETPRLSNKGPLFVWLYQTIFLAVPFLLPIVTCMKWIASGTSIGIFDYLIFEELKAKLKRQRAALVVFKKEPERTRLKGCLLLAVMLALLFVPLVIMSSTQTNGIANPANVASVSFGLSGLPDIYENQITTTSSTIRRADREAITDLDDESLIAFSTMSLEEIQVIRFPFSSMSQWIASPDAISTVLDILSDNTSSISLFGSVTFGFQKSTSENKVQNVKFDLYSNTLTSEQRMALHEILDGSNSTAEITIERLIPMFYQVGFSSAPTPVTKYSYDAVFRSTNHSGIPCWEMDTRPAEGVIIPEFMQTAEETVIVLWSGKSMGTIAGSLLSSAGGLLGLYSFILVTIGVWVSNWVSSHFTDLWITRMAHPEKLLMMLLALEAYKMTGDSFEEYKLAQNLLANLRSTTRIIEVTNAHSGEQEA